MAHLNSGLGNLQDGCGFRHAQLLDVAQPEQFLMVNSPRPRFSQIERAGASSRLSLITSFPKGTILVAGNTIVSMEF